MRPPYFAQNNDYKDKIESKGFSNEITIPFSPESELSGACEEEIISGIFYHRELDIPASFQKKKILLHFGAVFYHSEIYIDGKPIDFHDGGSSSFSVDITDSVCCGKSHNLVVKATSNLWDGSIPSGKQSNFIHSYKCFYTRTTGIWQTVWMEAVDPCSLSSLQIIPNFDDKTVTLIPHWYRISENQSVVFKILDHEGAILVQEKRQASTVPLSFDVSSCEAWSLEHPNLYEIMVETFVGSVSVDVVNSYFGLRKIEVRENQIYLNNEKLYQRLVLDQGYYPQSQWTAPSDDDLKQDILLAKKAGFNGARLHQKVFEERFYYWADTLGYLCWAESPSWGLDYNNGGIPARNFLSEWSEILRRDRNHPCIIAWTPLNETFQFSQPLNHRRLSRDAYNLCHAIDGTRPVNDASGYIHFVTDLWTIHTYEQNPEKLKELLDLERDGKVFRNFPEQESSYTGQPYLVDEFGGIKWDPDTQGNELMTQGQNLVSWGYGEAPRTKEEFLIRLKGLTDALLELDHIAGYCYTQLTDVEQEKNGIYFYDRSEKFDMDGIHAIFSKLPQGYTK
jgi:beta-galactosidase/beta-glucuronidase